MSKARTAAYRALKAIAEQAADLPTALERSRESLTDERDRGLVMDIVTGTLRWQRALDHLIAHFAQRPLAKVDADVLLLLRMGLYQLMHLDRVPAAAVVDEAVELTRLARKSSAAPFVNALLRNVVRQRHRLPLPARPEDAGDRVAALAWLGVTHSHPEWLVSRWLDRYGFDAAETWVRFNNDPPPLTLRANRLRTTREGLQAALAGDDVETAPTPFAPDGLIVTAGNPLRGGQDGSFVVQDEASQLVALAVGARPGEVVLDLCAAPGGKTTALAGEMQGTGFIVACDVRERRMRLLKRTLTLTGAARARPVQVDSHGALPFGARFDRVLVDAPCSGLGTVRRDPDIRWMRTEDELAVLAERQLVLLARAADVVKPGGRLVYATCSSEPEENDGVVAAFLREHPEFEPVDLRRELEAPVDGLAGDDGFLRTSPVQRLEAFFAAALIRRA